MARTTTTLSGALAVDENSMSVASATGFAAGMLARIDDEFIEITSDYVSGTSIGILRGREGTATQAHASGANVSVALGSDYAAQPPQTKSMSPIAAKACPLLSYTAAGAIALPSPGNNGIAVINGTAALAMTLAIPTKDMDGSILYIVANGKAAHTVTLATAIGNAGAGYTVLTFAAGGQNGCQFLAANGIWCALSAPGFAGTATNLLLTIT